MPKAVPTYFSNPYSEFRVTVHDYPFVGLVEDVRNPRADIREESDLKQRSVHVRWDYGQSKFIYRHTGFPRKSTAPKMR